jgi:hypothetical protein
METTEIIITGSLFNKTEGSCILDHKDQKVSFTKFENKNNPYVELRLIGPLDSSGSPVVIHKDEFIKVLKFLTDEN